MAQKKVTATEFQNRVGAYMEQSAKEPVFITKHRRPVRVLVDIDEYERLKRHDTRQALYPHELSDELIEELEKAKMGPEHDHLNTR
jgi:prevent-host-death family protein|tara:strand:- start:222 stop:479 length:258 start_codon:yes stop_codon:yes gene_type:complete